MSPDTGPRSRDSSCPRLFAPSGRGAWPSADGPAPWPAARADAGAERTRVGLTAGAGGVLRPPRVFLDNPVVSVTQASARLGNETGLRSVVSGKFNPKYLHERGPFRIAGPARRESVGPPGDRYPNRLGGSLRRETPGGRGTDEGGM